MDTSQTKGRQTHNLSCDPEESAAFEWLAAEDDRGVKAWTFQRFIDKEMRQRVGADWRSWVRSELLPAAEPEKEPVAA